MERPPAKNIRLWLWVSLICFSCSLVVVGSLLLFADRFVQLGMTASVYYLSLVALGLCASAFLFEATRSYAQYSGRVLSGTLKLSGPIVVVVLIVVLGFYIAPPINTRVLVIRLENAAQPSPLQGYVPSRKLAALQIQLMYIPFGYVSVKMREFRKSISLNSLLDRGIPNSRNAKNSYQASWLAAKFLQIEI
jgi:hypothetical protein